MANVIHPTAILDPTVEIGTGNYIGPYCVIGPKVKIGNNNRFENHVSIGAPPEHKSFWNGTYAGVEIGNDCTIREFVTINSGTTQNTVIQNGVALLKGSYVGHDCFVGNDVTLSCNAVLSGHCVVFEGANLGLAVLVHQYSIIGHYTMLGMGTVVTKTSAIRPCETYVGSPARFLKPNQHAIQRKNFSSSDLMKFRTEFESAQKKKTA